MARKNPFAHVLDDTALPADQSANRLSGQRRIPIAHQLNR